MKAYMIAIDGGTTNTRLTLMRGKEIIDRVRASVGARNAKNGKNEALYEAVRDGICTLLSKNALSYDDLSHIALSGMIGSEGGLSPIAHISAPVSRKTLGKALQVRDFPEIAPLPFVFVPGVKTVSDPNAHPLSSLDIMRGEETELFGLLADMEVGRRYTFVLPGSHMKIVEVDEDQRITAFRTSMSGELVRAAAENTILASSLDGVFPKNADEAYLKKGYDYALAHGIGEALFKVRVQATMLGIATKEQLYAFLLGAVLRDDVTSILQTGGNIVIAGSNPFRDALATLISPTASVTVIAPEVSDHAAAMGAYLLTEHLQKNL